MDPDGEEHENENNCAILLSQDDNQLGGDDQLVADELPMPEDIAENSLETALIPTLPTIQTTSTSQRPDDNMDVIEVEEVHNPICQQHCAVIKAALKKHFSYAYSNGQIQWPKPFTSYQKQHMPLIKVSNYFLILIL